MDTYTRKQEIVNGLTHGIGMIFGATTVRPCAGVVAKFRDLTFDTLEVVSPDTEDGFSHELFYGTPLDSVDVAKLFPGDAGSGLVDNEPAFFAVGKFMIDSISTALLIRMPSHYESSAIHLLVYKPDADSIVANEQLADYWGDAGDVYLKTAWLFKSREQQLQSFVWVEESHDNSVDNEADTTIAIRHYYSLLAASNARMEALTVDSLVLAKKFGYLIKRPNAGDNIR